MATYLPPFNEQRFSHAEEKIPDLTPLIPFHLTVMSQSIKRKIFGVKMNDEKADFLVIATNG